MRRAFLVLTACMALGACDASGDLSGEGFSASLGLVQPAPDEFVVLPRRPLRMPGDIALAEPRPGAPSLVDPDPFADARAALGRTRGTGGPSGGPGGVAPADGGALGAAPVTVPVQRGASPVEQALIAAAGAGEADPDIRDALDADREAAIASSPYALDSFFGLNLNPALAGDPLDKDDLDAEAARLEAEGYNVPARPSDTEE